MRITFYFKILAEPFNRHTPQHLLNRNRPTYSSCLLLKICSFSFIYTIIKASFWLCNIRFKLNHSITQNTSSSSHNPGHWSHPSQVILKFVHLCHLILLCNGLCIHPDLQADPLLPEQKDWCQLKSLVR